eukprot:1160106-Pelagomonas_calceolata.AAC.6
MHPLSSFACASICVCVCMCGGGGGGGAEDFTWRAPLLRLPKQKAAQTTHTCSVKVSGEADRFVGGEGRILVAKCTRGKDPYEASVAHVLRPTFINFKP